MPTAIFVHGTGVREPAFGKLFDVVRTKLRERRPDYAVVACYWGEMEGARLWYEGASVPKYDTARGLEPRPEEDALALWSLLYLDPLWELRVLASASRVGGELPPGQLPPGDVLDTRLRGLEPTADLEEALSAAGLTDMWEPARAAVIADPAYAQALTVTEGGIGELRQAVARAIVAYAIVRQNDEEAGTPALPDAAARDQVVVALRDALGGSDYGIVGHVTAPVRGLALRMVTNHARRRRGALTDAAYPAAGDILLYQTRGDGIRRNIAACVASAAEPVVLLTHSLGGIAAVDLLASRSMPTVRLLVTVGSQAPFLYEIDALWSLAHDDPLPDHVPAWLNIYDGRDLLSYIGALLFPGRVKDVEVDNGQPFPQSHSAYWTNRKVWDEIAASLP